MLLEDATGGASLQLLSYINMEEFYIFLYSSLHFRLPVSVLRKEKRANGGGGGGGIGVLVARSGMRHGATSRNVR